MNGLVLKQREKAQRTKRIDYETKEAREKNV